jgi:pimeloyl-ACP methyl ester carboxylesterase
MTREGPSDATPRSRRIDIDGPVHYVDYGGDGPPMILVHGLGGSHLNWAAVAPTFARKHRVLVPDLAGFGRTPLHGRRASVQANARLLAAFIERLADGPAVVLGNSMGGLVGLMVAAARPRLVRALVLVDAVHAPSWGSRIDPEVALIFSIYMVPGLATRVLAAHARRATPEQVVRQMMRLCYANPGEFAGDLLDAHVALETERRSMPWVREAFIEASRSILRMVLWPGRLNKVAAAVHAPTLVIHGERDRLVPLRAARAAAKRRHWDLEVLAGVGHVPQLEAPDRFVAAVERWLARLDTAARQNEVDSPRKR